MRNLTDATIMATEWYIFSDNTEYGPFSSEVLKQFAQEGRVVPVTPVKKGASGEWVPADRVKGLFTSIVDNSAPPMIPPPPPQLPTYCQPVAPPVPQEVAQSTEVTYPCPYCGEAILYIAKKCKHCGEFLDRDSCVIEQESHPIIITDSLPTRLPHTSRKEGGTGAKQGALIGSIASFGTGIVFMLFTLFSFPIYSSLFLAAFILSIVAMAQRRIVGGILMLILTVAVPPFLFLVLGVGRINHALKDFPKPASISNNVAKSSANDISDAKTRVSQSESISNDEDESSANQEEPTVDVSTDVPSGGMTKEEPELRSATERIRYWGESLYCR